MFTTENFESKYLDLKIEGRKLINVCDTLLVEDNSL